MHEQESSKSGARHRPLHKSRLYFLIGVGALILATGTLIWFVVIRQGGNPSPVPKAISESVPFPIYYPTPDKLPAGYTLDPSSFKHPIQNGVNYTVRNSKGQLLVFSLQLKPSAGELQNFSANYIPLHNKYQTPVGQALLGAYNPTKNGTETLVSLPTNSKTWIIITAPYDINQDQLKQVLSSLTKD